MSPEDVSSPNYRNIESNVHQTGYRFSFPGVKRLGRGVDQPSLFSVRVKKRVQLYFCSLFWAFTACYKVKMFTYDMDLPQFF
jgi:hypothetical protein